MIFLVALGLSMDAFSLSIIYGMSGIKNSKLIPLIVGLYHFVMPILGSLFGAVILKLMPIELNIVESVIFFFIGIEMILDSFKKEKISSLKSIADILIFGLAVSIDSFGTGIGIKYLADNILFASLVFALMSFALTYLGLKFGNKLGSKIGKYADIVGGILLIMLGLVYFF